MSSNKRRRSPGATVRTMERPSEGRNKTRSRELYPNTNARPVSKRTSRAKTQTKFFPEALSDIRDKLTSLFTRQSSEAVPSRGRKNRRNTLTVLLVIAGLVLGLTVYGIVWLFTNKNGMEVYFNGESVGIIRIVKDINKDEILRQAIEKLKEDNGGVNVEVSDTIETELVHASKFVSFDAVLKEIYTNFTYKVEAAGISVDGIEIAIVKSDADANTIKNEKINEYLQQGLNITESGFVEDFVITPKFVNAEEIESNDKAFEKLSANYQAEIIYEVVAGDMLSTIASKNDTTIANLLQLNPDITAESVLKIGQRLVLNVPTPLLSVWTIERTTYTEVATAEPIVQENPNLSKSHSKIIQQGKDGQKEVTVDITRVNGFITKKDIIDEKITTPPVPQITEKGAS